jgi:hypothetical protein
MPEINKGARHTNGASTVNEAEGQYAMAVQARAESAKAIT